MVLCRLMRVGACRALFPFILMYSQICVVTAQSHSVTKMRGRRCRDGMELVSSVIGCCTEGRIFLLSWHAREVSLPTRGEDGIRRARSAYVQTCFMRNASR